MTAGRVAMGESGRRGAVSWELIESLFDQAADLDPAEREEWLRANAGDALVVREVMTLLEASERQGILDGPSPIGPVTAPSTDEMRDRLDRALQNHYRIESVLGHGGMATVFRATELKHDRQVVMKVLRPEVARWVGAERFLAEIQIVARLSHPLIVSLIDSGTADGLLYFVMPYLGGTTLRDRLAEGPVPPNEAMGMLRDVAAALSHAHAAGLVHRDLKPDNVLLAGGHAYLMDFGVAKLRPEHGSLTETADGLTVGTPAYMAPEQSIGGKIDGRADVYGWGVLARETLLGRFDLSGKLGLNVPAPLGALIAECLQRDPERRPGDGSALLTRLEAIRGRGSRRSTGFLAMGLGIGAAAAGAALTFTSPEGPGLDSVAGPVVVAPLRNETGDSGFAVWGRLAGDWLTQGLQETGRVAVVPWPVALQSAAGGPESGDGGVAQLANETGAGTVVTGAYYLVGSSIKFQAQVIDVRTGTAIATIAPVEAGRDSVERAIRGLRDRLMGVLAVRTDARMEGLPGLAGRPPTYEAYRIFERGIELYNALDYGPAATTLIDAWRRDTVFVPPLIYAARAMWNVGERSRVDSLIREIRRRPALSSYHELQVRYLERMLEGDAIRALEAIRQAAAEAPGGRAHYNVALTALSVGRPALALEALETIDPDRGPVKGWAPYWAALTNAYHQLGRHTDELRAARAYRVRHPEGRAAWVHEVRALAATGDTAAIDSLESAAAALPPDTYWSQGAVLVIAGEELEAHGNEAAAGRYYRRALTWLANQLARNPSHRAHRYWMGSLQYDMGRFRDAGPYFESLARDFPDDLQFRGLHGLVAARVGDTAAASRRLGPSPQYERAQHLSFLARYAAIAGDRERSISLWSEALGRGLRGLVWLHASARRDLEPVAADSRFGRLGVLVEPAR